MRAIWADGWEFCFLLGRGSPTGENRCFARRDGIPYCERTSGRDAPTARSTWADGWGFCFLAWKGKSCESRRTHSVFRGPPVGTRLRRGLHGQVAENFAFLLGRGSPMEAGGPPVGTRLRRGLYGQTAGDFAFCSEGEVLWKQADHVKRRSGPSYGRIGCFSVITWKRNRLSLLGRALDLIMKIALLAGKPSGSAVQMCFFDMQLL